MPEIEKTPKWKAENASIAPIHGQRCEHLNCQAVVTHVATFPGVLDENVKLCTAHATKEAVEIVLNSRAGKKPV